MSELKLTKKDLNEMSTKELMSLAKDNNVPRYNGKNRKTKQELVDLLFEEIGCVENGDISKEENIVIQDEVISSGSVEIKGEDVTVKAESEQMNDDIPPVKEYEPWKFESREKQIEEAEPGTLMAFLDMKGKPRTAAMITRSSKRKQVKLVTEFDAEFIVPYDNVLWVKKGLRWPRGIYNLLKGITNET